MINTNKKINRSNFPYPYIIIEDFFENEFYKKIEFEFPIKKDFLKNRREIDEKVENNTDYNGKTEWSNRSS